MWDFVIPQQAANMIYKDNDACTTIANVKNLHHALGILISNVLHFVNGSNEIYSP